MRYTKKRLRYGVIEVYDSIRKGWVILHQLPISEQKECKDLPSPDPLLSFDPFGRNK